MARSPPSTCVAWQLAPWIVGFSDNGLGSLSLAIESHGPDNFSVESYPAASREGEEAKIVFNLQCIMKVPRPSI